MVPSEAIGFSLAALGIFLGQLSRPWRIGGFVAMGFTALLGLLELRHDLFGAAFEFNEFFLRFLNVAAPPEPSLTMSGVSAVGLLLIGVASPLSNTRFKLLTLTSQLFLAAVSFVSMHAILGYAYSMKSFYQWGGTTPVPFNSSLAFFPRTRSSAPI